ncbi:MULTISPECIES: hypothetical protein [Pseudobacteroides]|uniref:Uncharacterized protein n=1 Tax=Pseudobacteroides cellulosolvens ATCC 35603 = DSM 2933 TaxID=398512 RepID=A0A0L6JTG1_9FIRM|nr:hypothetical protein [Pseudobacteroides cellulosolvens]KNY29004.1 hypothetical protein Bccel_4278 [Pseudobacteroides cellulosolvens ATCC 35603 = DSM 2933]
MSPIQAITHYAKVKSIEASPIKPSKKLITFDGCPIELDLPIVLGEANANSMRSPRYTTLERLMNPKEISDLL